MHQLSFLDNCFTKLTHFPMHGLDHVHICLFIYFFATIECKIGYIIGGEYNTMIPSKARVSIGEFVSRIQEALELHKRLSYPSLFVLESIYPNLFKVTS